MSIKQWSKKKKAALTIGIILLAAVIAGVLYMLFKPEPAPQVSVATAEKGSITQTLDVSGKVESSKKGAFIPIDGTKVLTVKVQVGDTVKKGDVLATFDTSALNSVLAEKQQAYLSAVKNYNSAQSSSVQASAQLRDIEKQLEEIDKKIAEQEKLESSNKPNSSNSVETQQPDKKPTAMDKFWNLISDALGMQDINAALEQLNGIFNNGSDLSGMLGSQTSQLELEKMQLELKKVMLEAQSGSITQSTYKTIMEAAKTDLDNVTQSVNTLKNGWIAEYDGIVSEVNIKEGQICRSGNGASGKIDISTIINLAGGSGDVNALISSLLGTTQNGITVEYYPLTASFVLNKYDVLNVKLDQPCRVIAADDSELSGAVTYISPVASTSGTTDINSLLGSGSAAGVDAQVTINNPTRSVIIGLDVDISIDLASKDNVVLVPTEAIKNNSEGNYVYIYNPKTKRVSISPVKVGLSDNINYEILSGCKEGDIVLTSVPTGVTLTDGQKVAMK